MKEKLNILKEMKEKEFIQEEVLKLREASNTFAAICEEKCCHKYTHKDALFEKNGSIVLYIGYGYNRQEKVLYILNTDGSDYALREYAHSTLDFYPSDKEDSVIKKRTCYGFGSWGTTYLNKKLETVEHKEARESFGCCAD